ncbi:histone chaperone asf1b-B-like [Physella acuta]|uniref:histone chaperone asf1b-B-like n=1 Tax=Physella acuta TaxID=109671 RepID=UPI0027DEA524|nr:histone chaperone asf1b-B-like [Physella acuta]XP_059149485.1 histone chaperone asf1b-B-like [Physella acuta]
MALVNICDVTVLNNPTSFLKPFQFEITFECTEDLPEDLEWRIIYVGSAESMEHDQVLDTILVGPVPGGKHMFVFEADPPDVKKIPVDDVMGVTVVLLTCSYRGKEFIRVGYYVNNEYDDPELKENPPAEIQYHKLQRNILSSEVRVTRFTIPWHDTKGTQEEEEKMEEEAPATSDKPAPKISEEFDARIAQDLAYERAERERMTNKVPFADPGNIYPQDGIRCYHSEDSSSLCMP